MALVGQEVSPHRARRRILVFVPVLALVAVGAVAAIAGTRTDERGDETATTRPRPTLTSTTVAPDVGAHDPTTSTTTGPPTTITEGSSTCTVVDRPTSGEGAVPADDGTDRLAASITWTTSLVLDPPTPTDQATFPVAGLDQMGLGTDGITKLARVTDPLHRDFIGQNRLVWATFYPQAIGFRSGPAGLNGSSPRWPQDAPCSKVVSLADAATGAPITIFQQ